MRRFVAAVFFALLVPGLAFAERPRLGVLIVVDQLSAWQLEARLERSRGGFRRLATEGFRFKDVRHETAPTVTSAGHATIGTGTWPATHGIVANEWLDRTTGKVAWATEDRRYQVVGRPPSERDGTGPGQLRVGTLGDSTKASFEKAKVVAVSGKDRSAVLLVGASADLAIWFDSASPRYVTSTLYADKLPEWVEAVNGRIAQQLEAGLVWTHPKGRFPPEELARRYARDLGGFGVAFPHEVKKGEKASVVADQVSMHPLSGQTLVELALGAVSKLELGKDEVPDLLTVGMSRLDEVGHTFGPDSPENEQTFDELDADLFRLLAGLDQAVGKGRYVVVLTADHGVGHTVELLADRGLDAGRVDIKGLLASLEAEADQALGKGDWFENFRTPGFFAQPSSRSRLAEARTRLQKVARAFPGVFELAFPDELLAGRYGEAGAFYRNGWVPDRSPDLFLWMRPYWVSSAKDAASHGSWHLYDRSVPLLLAGPGVKQGSSAVPAKAIDVAPTLARLLGVEPPADCQGQALEAAMRPLGK